MTKLIVGPIPGGQQTDVLPFVVDNGAFPVLQNAYQWRKRILRKRGTNTVGRLTRYFDSNSTAYGSIASFTLNGSGKGNLFTGFGLDSAASLVIDTLVLVATGPQTYRDITSDGFLTPTGTGGTNTVDYNTGDISIPLKPGATITATFYYYPSLPVLGIEDLVITSNNLLNTLAFDTEFAYNLITDPTYPFYSVSFYKNPPTNAYTNYVQKTTWTPTSWNGQDYQQYYSTNYQGAFWVTNGVPVPFSATNIGMQFAPRSTITYVSATSGTPSTITVTITNCPLVVGDFVFFNEWTGTNAAALNFQTGYVTTVSGAPASLTVTVTFPNATLIAGPFTPGIIQYLTNRSDATKDVIRWYDGDPTTGVPSTPTFAVGNGWVNFMPPLSQSNFSIAMLPAAQYYLVGARLIQQFKDRLVFFGPVVQTSTGIPIYLKDTIVYSQNGTAYYTASFTGDPALATTVFNAILVPVNETATAPAYWEDLTGFGGFLTSGVNQPFLTAIKNEDVFIVGTPGPQLRLTYTGSDLLPFAFYVIDDELQTSSTFSAINMGYGSVTRGNRGIIVTTQREAKRIDLPILDNVFQMNLLNNGSERFTAIRDYLSEWIYFTYPTGENGTIFPNNTLLYNYRDNTWATFRESYTTYGNYQQNTFVTWATVGTRIAATWAEWNQPWNNSTSSVSSPIIVGGNQRGFVLERENAIKGSTSEGNSIPIDDYNVTTNVLTSTNHGFDIGDYIIISGAVGGPRGINGINGNTYQVVSPLDASPFVDNFSLRTILPMNITGTYIGGGLIKKAYVPFIQTKQFPLAWNLARKTRIGVQQYLLTTTANSQITLQIYLSQSSAVSFNTGPIVPAPNTINSALVYSTVLYTCPESTNLGLTPANVNIMTINNADGTTPQEQIWHRINTSLIGDTVQLAFTLSDAQMFSLTSNNKYAEIELHGFTLEVYASQLLS